MNPEEIKEAIKQEHEFRQGTLRARVPYANEYGFSSGVLTGPARELFVAEVSYQTLRYVVISGQTPILWRGSFDWIMPGRTYMRNVNHEDYLLILEVKYELDKDIS